MRYGSHDAVSGLLADYCGVLHEATFLLRILAKASGDERRDEFDALVDVHAESRPIHHALMSSLTKWPDSVADPWVTDARRLTTALHASLGRVVRTGNALVNWDGDQVPNEVIQQCRVVERGGSSLARVWEEHHDLAAAERRLCDVRSGLDALDQALNVHQPV